MSRLRRYVFLTVTPFFLWRLRRYVLLTALPHLTALPLSLTHGWLCRYVGWFYRRNMAGIPPYSYMVLRLGTMRTSDALRVVATL